MIKLKLILSVKQSISELNEQLNYYLFGFIIINTTLKKNILKLKFIH